MIHQVIYGIFQFLFYACHCDAPSLFQYQLTRTTTISNQSYKSHSMDLRRAVLKSNIRRFAASSGSASMSETLAIENDPDFVRESSEVVDSQPSNLTPSTTSPIEDSEEAGGDYEEHDEQSIYSQLEKRFWKVVLKTADRGSSLTVAEFRTTYAEASKDEVFAVITACVALICYIATKCVPAGQDASLRLAVFRKWSRFLDPDAWNRILEKGSVDGLRDMLVAVFGDAETYLDVVNIKGETRPVVKVGVGLPDAGQEWC